MTHLKMMQQPTLQKNHPPQLGRRLEPIDNTREPGDSDGHWWEILGFSTKKKALTTTYTADKQKGNNMTAKCFASRLYGKLKKSHLDLARAAHRDAVDFFP